MTPRTIPEHRRVEHERRRKAFNDARAEHLAAWDEVFGWIGSWAKNQKQEQEQEKP